MKPGGKTWIETDLIHSKAFGELTGQSPRVLLIFHTRRNSVPIEPRKRGGKREYVVTNNGKLTFTYRDAAKKGISTGQFIHALNQLVRFGFLDVTHAGTGVVGDPSTYALSERWRDWGNPKFQSAERSKDMRRVGFQNPANRRSKRKSTRENTCGTARENTCGETVNEQEAAPKNTCSVDAREMADTAGIC